MSRNYERNKKHKNLNTKWIERPKHFAHHRHFNVVGWMIFIEFTAIQFDYPLIWMPFDHNNKKMLIFYSTNTVLSYKICKGDKKKHHIYIQLKLKTPKRKIETLLIHFGDWLFHWPKQSKKKNKIEYLMYLVAGLFCLHSESLIFLLLLSHFLFFFLFIQHTLT